MDSIETCLARVAERVRKGGHDVPESDVRRRFSRSCSNFWKNYRFSADQWLLCYTAQGNFWDIATGSGEDFKVIDAINFEHFLRVAKS